jgi:large subunit ribosomal protein L25
MTSKATKLSISERAISNSRETRRLRRSGQVPGILYGGTEEPFAFSVDERELRHALAASGAVLDLDVGGKSTTAVLQDSQHNVVRGDTLHVDFLRVRLDVAIHAVVPLELTGGEDAPGVTEGGVIEHILREVNIEALPNEIPERLEADVSAMQINDTVFLSAVRAPEGVTILDDLEENTVATLSPPKLEAELDALGLLLELGVERVGEDGEPAEGAEAEGDGDGAEASGDGDPSSSEDQ